MRLLPVALALAVGAMTPAFALNTTQSNPATPSAATPNTNPSTAGKLQEFKTEAEAKTACGTQPVVWANPSSHVLHPSGSRYYGKTKKGGYACEGAAEHAGYHMAKNG